MTIMSIQTVRVTFGLFSFDGAPGLLAGFLFFT